ncbi:MAG TPA: extracellular solute-binding protein [Candidatus Acidoferrum sp.]|nr:extracellular solute-binding protein [Candidatus Acidoferrum sp.]
MRSRAFTLRLGLAVIGSVALFLGVAPAPAAEEVVLYTARHYGQEKAFDAFTQKTGIQIKTLNGEAGPLLERLKAEGERSPADVFFTVDAGNLWNAARAGVFAPVTSAELTKNVPAHLRDPEHRWFGLTMRARTIMYNTKKVNPADLSTYEALGEPRWKGRLCLRSSGYIYNQSLLATMIKRHGEPRAEQIVKGWVANQPTIISGDTKILEAIAAGQCDVGLTNTYYLARLLAKDPNFPVAPLWANQATTGTHVNVSGGGVTAHAKNRAGAIKLLEFLSTLEAQQMFADTSMEFPVNPKAEIHAIVRSWGPFKQDDVNVAAAGEFQAAATRLADRAGYK